MALRSACRSLCLQPRTVFARMIASKMNRQLVDKPAPFPQDERDFNFLKQMTDFTTTRLGENSRVIVLDGAHAVGKTKLAKELAEEFGMKHFGYPRVADLYTNFYGVDLRKYNDYFCPINVPYDETNFARNPTGPVEGCGDRFLWHLYNEKLRNYVFALKHLLNTGQGVVVEGSPFCDYAHFDAAYNQGWVSRSTRAAYRMAMRRTFPRLLRPNVIMYLDAPVDRVIKNIKERGNEWDKDSPVWTNERYLTDIYVEIKRHFLKEQKRHSYVLVYDWSDGGDTEVVVEDIEALELDRLEEYSDLQRDWKIIRKELEYSEMRSRFCNRPERNAVLVSGTRTIEAMYAEHLWWTSEDVDNYKYVFNDLEESEMFAPGYNPLMGDKGLFWKFPSDHLQLERASRVYCAQIDNNRLW